MGNGMKERKLDSSKNRGMKKYIAGIAIVIAVSLILAFAVELFSNMKLLTLDSKQKGVKETAFSETVFDTADVVEGDPENGLEYRPHPEYEQYQGKRCYYIEPDSYVNKLVLDYENVSAAYFDILVLYENRFGYLESWTTKDDNPMYISHSTVRIDKNVKGMWIIPMDNNTPQYDNEVTLTGVSIRNAAVFNHFRFLFIFLMSLAAGLIIVLRKQLAKQVEYGFLIVGLCSGIIFTLAMPLSRVGWDEETHLRSVYWLDITGSYEYNCFLHNYIDGGAENLPFEYSTTYEEYMHVFDRVNELSTPSESDPATSHRWGTSGFATFSYFFMAVTCNICKLFGVPFAYTYILLRMTNMLMYVIVVFLAVRKLPKGKLIMSAIALMPTPMYLASTISYDTVVTGFLFLGMAYLFYLMFTDNKLTWWEYLVFIGGMAYGSSRKSIYIPLILLGVFLPHRIFKDKKQERIMKTGVVLVLLVILSTFVLPAIFSPSAEGDLRGGTTSHAGQMSAVFSNPAGYAALLLSTMWQHLWDFGIGTPALDFMAYLGAGSLTYVIVIYLVTITITSENTVYVKDNKNRWAAEGMPLWLKALIYFLVFGVMCLIWTSMYISYTEVGKTAMAGVQGRYYIPLLFPVLFTLSFNKVNTNRDKVRYNMVCMLISTFIIFYSIWEILIRQCSL